MAQLAVGLTHAQRGNARGAVALLDRAADGLRRWAGTYPAGVDGPGLATAADELAREFERTGEAALPPEPVRLRG